MNNALSLNFDAAEGLCCRDLAVGYRPGRPVLTGINLDFEPGRFTTLLGPNGAGKTTLLRTLSRHLKPLAGAIAIGGRPLASFSQGELARVMAVVLTDRVDPPFFKVSQFVALGRYPHTDFLGRLRRRDREVVNRALAAVQAAKLAGRDFSTLSDGERQKILVARALAQEPRILLLDEPTAHLDLRHRLEVMAILRNLCREHGLTVIASLHDIDIAAKVSDRVVLVKEGGICAAGYPEKVLTDTTVTRLYNFTAASFDQRLGGIEFKGRSDRQKVFVIAGMGSGATLYRLLNKHGYRISTGVLHSNDLDYFVARSLDSVCISQEPAASIAGPVLEWALVELKSCDLVIDSGFAAGRIYRDNLALVEKAISCGKPVFSLRPPTERPFLQTAALTVNMAGLQSYTNPNQLLEAIEKQARKRS